jgi:hypothetical protein
MNLAGEAYRVMYCKKSDKKRKIYQDGSLRVVSECMTLMDDDGKEIYKKKASAAAVQIGVDMILGGFELQIEEAIPVSIKTTIAEGYVSHISSMSNISYSTAPKPNFSTKINTQKGVGLDPTCSELVQKIDTKTVKKFVSGSSIYTYVYIFISIYTFIYVYVYIYVYMYINTYIYIHIYIYIYIYNSFQVALYLCITTELMRHSNQSNHQKNRMQQ